MSSPPGPLARLGLIGDIHAEDERLATALAYVRDRGVDLTLLTGDVVDGPGSTERCRTLLEAAGPVALVRGNHDRWLLQGSMRDLPGATALADVTPATLAYLSRLPATRRFDTIAGALLLCHGLGANDMARLTPDDWGYALESNDDLNRILAAGEVDLVVHGHTHRRMVRAIGHVTFINPGTLLRGHDPGFAIADLNDRTVRWSELLEPGCVAEGREARF